MKKLFFTIATFIFFYSCSSLQDPSYKEILHKIGSDIAIQDTLITKSYEPYNLTPVQMAGFISEIEYLNDYFGSSEPISQRIDLKELKEMFPGNKKMLFSDASDHTFTYSGNKKEKIDYGNKSLLERKPLVVIMEYRTSAKKKILKTIVTDWKNWNRKTSTYVLSKKKYWEVMAKSSSTEKLDELPVWSCIMVYPNLDNDGN